MAVGLVALLPFRLPAILPPNKYTHIIYKNAIILDKIHIFSIDLSAHSCYTVGKQGIPVYFSMRYAASESISCHLAVWKSQCLNDQSEAARFPAGMTERPAASCKKGGSIIEQKEKEQVTPAARQSKTPGCRCMNTSPPTAPICPCGSCFT